MKINTKLTTEVQFFYFKGREHQLIQYDLSHIKLIWDLMLKFIVTKFGADWFIFLDVRE